MMPRCRQWAARCGFYVNCPIPILRTPRTPFVPNTFGRSSFHGPLKGPTRPSTPQSFFKHKFSGAIGHPVRRGSPPQGTTHAPTPSLFHAHPGKRFQVLYQCQLKPHEAGFNE